MMRSHLLNSNIIHYKKIIFQFCHLVFFKYLLFCLTLFDSFCSHTRSSRKSPMCTRTFLTRTRLCSQLMSHSTAVRFCRGHLSCQSCLLIRRTTLSASMYFSNNKNNKTKQDKQRCNSVLDVNFMNVCE